MPTVVENRPHTDAVLEVLALTGKPVDYAEAPDDGGWLGAWGNSTFEPYVVAVLEDVTYSGPIGDPQADATLIYDIISVGRIASQAEWMDDKARGVLTKTNFEALNAGAGIPGRKMMGTVWHSGGGARLDDSVQPPIYAVQSNFTLMTTV